MLDFLQEKTNLNFYNFLKTYINLSSFQWEKLAPAAIDTSSVEVATFIFTSSAEEAIVFICSFLFSLRWISY